MAGQLRSLPNKMVVLRFRSLMVSSMKPFLIPVYPPGRIKFGVLQEIISNGFVYTLPPPSLACSVQFSPSVVSDSCDPMVCSMPGFPVHYQLLELTQTNVHSISDAIQPSHPLSSPSSPAFNLSQDQGLFKWVSSSHQVAKVLKFQLQYQYLQWIFRTEFL